MCVKNLASGTEKRYLPQAVLDKLPEHFVGYKLITKGGKSTVTGQKYSSGLKIAKNSYGEELNETSAYDGLNPSGIHVYLSKNAAANMERTWDRLLVPILCCKSDVIAIDNEQAALTKVIVIREWWPLKRVRKQKPVVVENNSVIS